MSGSLPFSVVGVWGMSWGEVTAEQLCGVWCVAVGSENGRGGQTSATHVVCSRQKSTSVPVDSFLPHFSNLGWEAPGVCVVVIIFLAWFKLPTLADRLQKRPKYSEQISTNRSTPISAVVRAYVNHRSCLCYRTLLNHQSSTRRHKQVEVPASIATQPKLSKIEFFCAPRPPFFTKSTNTSVRAPRTRAR